MNSYKFRRLALWLGVAALLAALLACATSTTATPTIPVSEPINTPTTAGGDNIPPTTVPTVPENTQTATPVPIVHTLIPGEPPVSALSEITDRNSSTLASEHRANGGDSFTTNLFERSFNANTMDIYFQDLDIIRTRLSHDDLWVYVNISLVGQNPAGGLPEDYGIEVDLNVDGRGDVLLMASKPGPKWLTDGVRVWVDNNHDVGGTHPIQSDPPASTDGYETLIFDQGIGSDSDAAWARISPTDPNSVQVAFKRSLINDDEKFTWGAWAMNDSMLNPAWFDYNDHFTAADAGSPLVELTQFYPIKALAEVDNTCRWAVGFTPTGNEPGICPVPPTPTPVLPGTISGIVFDNGINGGLVFGPASMRISGANVRARSGGCGSPGSVVTTATTNASGFYSLTVPAGTYCVDVSPSPRPTDHETGPQSATVTNGCSVGDVNFGYYAYLGIR